MKVETKKLKLFLLDSGLVSSRDIVETEKKIKKNGEYLGRSFGQRRKGFRGRLKGLEAYILGIPFVELEKKR